jgi:outer membrane protein TolC
MRDYPLYNPDLFDVERARIEIARAEVQRHPRLQLLGEIGSGRAGATGTVTDPEIVGPTQTMPPFDAQRMQAVLEVRQADYLAAASELRSRATEAAREAAINAERETMSRLR